MTPESFAAWWEPFRVEVLKEPKEGVVETVYLDVKGQVKLTGKQQFLKGKACDRGTGRRGWWMRVV